MDRAWKENASNFPPTPPAFSGGFPTEGTSPADATFPGAWWFHMITEELRNAIAQLGEIPNHTDTAQLATALTAKFSEVRTTLERLDAEIKEAKLFKFPNATIVGTPMIQSGQVSAFSLTNYLMFPFVVDFQGYPFRIDFCFTTGSDTQTQQNLFDSEFGLAFAVRSGRLELAASTSGSSWEVDAYGTYTIETNATYYVRIEWDGALISVGISTDGEVYTPDIQHALVAQPYPRQIFIGGAPALFGQASHPFGGSINLNRAQLFISSMSTPVWTGMDDVGLATRLAVDLSNIDSAGEQRIKNLVGSADVIMQGIADVCDEIIARGDTSSVLDVEYEASEAD